MTRFTSTDPATEAVNWEGEAASPAQVQTAVDAARAAFPDWADRPRQDRIDAVKRYQAVLKDRAPQIAEAIARETGKPLWETKTEAAAMIGKVDISIRAYDERTALSFPARGRGAPASWSRGGGPPWAVRGGPKRAPPPTCRPAWSMWSRADARPARPCWTPGSTP